ncbi:unnamed protein product [Polarella glacialis]|uniref:Uncharacterized protein n=1 Tax=Polarella glacialis TaxID=89957 RepID=A0A813G8I1_POLGL|nr:unnamed protein product [Polarella glacialis]
MSTNVFPNLFAQQTRCIVLQGENSDACAGAGDTNLRSLCKLRCCSRFGRSRLCCAHNFPDGRPGSGLVSFEIKLPSSTTSSSESMDFLEQLDEASFGKQQHAEQERAAKALIKEFQKKCSQAAQKGETECWYEDNMFFYKGNFPNDISLMLLDQKLRETFGPNAQT